MTADTDDPNVFIVDPSLWQMVANIASTSLENAQANGSIEDALATQQMLTSCLGEWATHGEPGIDGVSRACTNELASMDASIGPRLLAALEYDPPDVAPPTAAAADGAAAEVTTEGAGSATETGVPSEAEPHDEEVGATQGGELPAKAPKTWSRPGSRAFVAPSSGVITSTFGDARDHGGIDIANTLGAPIVAVADGEVISAGPAQGYGLWVRIRHDDGTITTYGHNDDNLVEVGQRVKGGQKIATVGNRGNSTGPHLHFEVEIPNGDKTDPLEWLTERGASIIGLD